MLKLSNGRKVKVGIVFECPEDEFIELAQDPDVKVAVAEEHGEQADIDKAMGLQVSSFAQLTIVRRGGFTEASVFMTKGELIKHIYEARAVLRSMDEAARLADREWAGYRKGLRRERDED